MPRISKKAVNLNPGRKSKGKRVQFKQDGTPDKAARIGAWSLNRKDRNGGVYDHPDWKSLRLHVLQETPLCVYCTANHRVTPATEVDHICPVRIAEDRAWDVDNLASVCKSCHSKKTAYENNLKSIPTEPDLEWWIAKLNNPK